MTDRKNRIVGIAEQTRSQPDSKFVDVGRYRTSGRLLEESTESGRVHVGQLRQVAMIQFRIRQVVCNVITDRLDARLDLVVGASDRKRTIGFAGKGDPRFALRQPVQDAKQPD